MFTTDTPHVETIWFTAWDSKDLMAILLKDEADGGWILRWRFKYYQSSTPFDEQDRENHYEICTEDGTVEKGEALGSVFNGIMLLASQRGRVHIQDRLDVRGNGTAALAALITKPWCHVRAEDTTGLPLPMVSQPPLTM